MRAPSSPSESLNWSFPGGSIIVRVPVAVMQKLMSAIRQREVSVPEVGGVLLGSCAELPSIIDIRAFVCLPSAPQTEGEYALDAAAVQKLRQAEGAPGQTVIGYFRSQAKGFSELREQELDLVKKYFPEPSNVVLLIQTQQKTAGFFCWCGDFFTPVSFNDFSVDLASREGAPLAPIGRSPAIASVSERLFARAVLASVAAILIVAFLAAPPGVLWRSKQQTAFPAPALPLNLQLEGQGEGLSVRWNAASTIIQRAAHGNLVILEPDKPPQHIALSPSELLQGCLYYRSAAERLEFRMEITDPLGRVERESALAVSPGAGVTTPAPIVASVRPIPVAVHNVTAKTFTRIKSLRRHNPGPPAVTTAAAELPSAIHDPAPRPANASTGFFWR